ncbi:MAG: glycine betaine ABC transporter substrate-binding protein [Phycisphaerae bacterium]
MTIPTRILLCLALVAAMSTPASAETGSVRVGSKSFTESVILGEIAAHLARHAGLRVEYVKGLGGTRLLWEALLAGQIDVYAEYTGTLTEEIFAGRNVHGEAAIRAALESAGLLMTRPLGFNNTYAIGMKEARAAPLGIRTISDLRDHPDLVLRFSNEFMQRGDGWPSLAQRYRLPQQDVRGLEHALAYEAIDKGVIDVTDLYATDAKIRVLALRVLEDDLSHFPRYDAAFIYRADLADRAPDFVAALRGLEGRIDERTMIDMNARVEIEGVSESRAAAGFLADTLSINVTARDESVARALIQHTREHLWMVFVSLSAAILVAIPLGVFAANSARFAQPVLAAVGVIQTIPAIALLVMLIRPVSYFSDAIGFPQAVVALFLYSLLPIVRNTCVGLNSIPTEMKESAIALGLPRVVRLWQIEMPLASRTILAGVKTAAVFNVGFATLGGFIGAGGYGEPIFTGIRLNNYATILQGALPAAGLALLAQGMFELAERHLVPKGLRLKAGR